MPSFNEPDNSNNNGPTLNNPFGSNSFPTPTASWTQLSPRPDDDRRYDERRFSGAGEEHGISSSQKESEFPFFQPQGYDPFEQMAKE